MWQWLYYIIVGTIEILLIGHRLIGVDFKKGLWKYVFFFMVFVSGIFLRNVGIEGTDYFILWVFFVVLCLFKGHFWEWLKNGIVIFFSIVIMDYIVWGLSLFFVDERNVILTQRYSLLSGIGGLFVWLFFVWLLWRKKRSLELNRLSVKQSFFMITGMMALCFLLSFIYGFLDDGMSFHMKKVAIIVCVVVVIYMLVVFFYLANMIQKKRYLEQIANIQYQYTEAQRNYFQKSIEKYEELRGFRHDIKNHMQILRFLCEERNYSELEEYVKRLYGDYIIKGTIHTGNLVVDCLFAEYFCKEETDREKLVVMGRLPEKLPMDDTDTCILFSNAFRNAAEALEKVDGEKKMELEIRQGDSELGILIRNSVYHQMIDIGISSKENKENHGYGIKNMKRIVKKYQGDISWKVTDGVMEVAIYLPFKMMLGSNKNYK